MTEKRKGCCRFHGTGGSIDLSCGGDKHRSHANGILFIRYALGLFECEDCGKILDDRSMIGVDVEGRAIVFLRCSACAEQRLAEAMKEEAPLLGEEDEEDLTRLIQ